ncbi:hypothetical protein PMAYCL1PPCAC_29736, partial [Pristionchus mayeri]
IRDAMLDLSATPIFLFIPFVAFFILFVVILALKICCSSILVHSWISRIVRRRKASSAPRNTPNLWRTPTSSTDSIEVLRAEAVARAANHSRDQPVGEPPGYYAGMLTVTETSGMYAMQVPNYTVVQNNSSLRDPRHFGGLAGIAAPPPYPPPPAYSQISSFPEMPGRNPSSSAPLPLTTCNKISEFPPVA